MGIFPRMGQRSKILLPIRTNLTEYNEIPELTTISSNTSIPSVQDGPTVVQRYRNLVIGAGATLTTQNRCCGMVLIVDGDLTVNGTISMTARGASFQPSADYRIKNELLPGNDILYEIDIPATADEIAAFLVKEKRRYHSLDELPAVFRPTLYCRGPSGNVYAPADLGAVPAVGGAGASGVSSGSSTYVPGGNGVVGTNRKCGGGGSGASFSNSTSGSGSAGTCYSGGSGGGAASWNKQGYSGGSFGGAGGAGNSASTGASGGAGNPGGTFSGGGGNGGSGTGGLLVIVCSGSIQISESGQIVAKGSAGGGSGNNLGGGGSGGGSINIFYGVSLINNGSISAAGGAEGYSSEPLRIGGKGGDGCVTTDHYNF